MGVNMEKTDLKGTWSFCLDKEKSGVAEAYYKNTFKDTIELPATVSTAQKGKPSKEENTGCLTDPYFFEGYTWYSREVDFSEAKGKELFLVLERTRVSHVWMDEIYIGSNNSLCTSHRYRLTPYANKRSKLTVMIDNTSYPVRGGHMTSPDTQTNWNGITGEIYIEVCGKIYLTGVKIFPDGAKRHIEVRATLNGAAACRLTAWVSDGEKAFPKSDYRLTDGENSFIYYLDETAKTWSEHTPFLYRLNLELKQDNGIQIEEYNFSFGLRDFKAAGKYFEINGMRTFLRGKHDGLLFPMTGHAPTDMKSWLEVLGTAKQYGINHYRFHTCCPPEACFAAADLLGIYLEPELPFWGTVTEEGEENHDEDAQQYLIREGFRILDEFGNHPSFVMLSMGNELWGSKERLNRILGEYKKYDTRHLYTQGSNNFQFIPCILENEDFFCGVRFSRDRLFRGSYAMCDAPQGHIQTIPPDTVHNYDLILRPSDLLRETAAGGELTVQYGTGIKTVKTDASREIIPEIPVVSHEIGQYAMFPDFSEIGKYTGVLKAKNLEIFKKRMEAKGLLAMAELFFLASGRFAAECYKAEIETALRSNELAGFQILDLQDFTGQGTALIGILNAFMESKGLISAGEWQRFCSDTVLLAELPGMVFTPGENVNIGIKLAVFRPEVIAGPRVVLSVSDGNKILISEENILQDEYFCGIYKLCNFTVKMPEVPYPKKLTVRVEIAGTGIVNSYDIWLYPEVKSGNSDGDIIITGSMTQACQSLKQGRKVLLYPESLDDTNSIPGTYCTDFWCYPMFRSISESMGKPVPAGTLGLRIEKEHPIFRYFPAEYHTTAQWYDIVTNSRALILDGVDVRPVVWAIDNFERNHKLGTIFELKAGNGRLFVCTSDLRRLRGSIPAKWLEYSILKYMGSAEFEPKAEIGMDECNNLFHKRQPG